LKLFEEDLVYSKTRLSPDTTWAEPSIDKAKLAKESPGVSTTRDQTKE